MSTETEKKTYKQTLNLPQTPFPMEARLVQNEPLRLQCWKEARLYEKVLAARARADHWVLHDGPPFANADIHMGHVLNKVLKDVIIRFRTMQGFQAHYVPGWDCHGLPIEHVIQQQLGFKIRTMPVQEVRKLCFDHASKFVGVQSQQFQRLGILGEWSNPYLTMKPEYEAATLDIFASVVEAGLVYKKLKPVPWSVQNQTALADAELEYKDVEDSSVYVEFPAYVPSELLAAAAETVGTDVSKADLSSGVHFLIWTTTPWTLPANMAIAVNPNVVYAFVLYSRAGKPRVTVLAEDLVERVFEGRAGIESYQKLNALHGSDLIAAGLRYRHPFANRVGRIVAADYVTTTDGTGLVHTAPGHGEDDYETGMREKLDVYSPVRADGRFDDTVPEWIRGKTVWEANPIIVQQLSDAGLLLAEEKITHSYPHDWRSKKPIIFRATEQWFIAIDKPFVPACGPSPLPSPGVQGEGGQPKSLRHRALEAAARISFVPEWGRARLVGMLQSRPDWCISRQRAWGMPIPVFYNEIDEPLLTPASVRAVAKRFCEKGSDVWFTEAPAELLGSDFVYPQGFDPNKLRKEKDIFDVWFESGSSWHAEIQCRS
jgi:isoleucyl-tRNA synthetase